MYQSCYEPRPVNPHAYQPSHQSFNFHQTNNSSLVFATKKLENINCIEESSPGIGALFLGDIISVMKPDIIENNKIEAVLSCLPEENYSLKLSSSLTTLRIPVRDTLDYPLQIHFNETFNFIEQMRNANKNVLVHCHAGVSRSAAIVCAYLMRKKGIGFESSLQVVKERRSRAKPNENFCKILKDFEIGMVNNRAFGSYEERSNKTRASFYENCEKEVTSSNYRNSLDLTNSESILRLSKIHETQSTNVPLQKQNKTTKSKYEMSGLNKRRYSNAGISIASKSSLIDSRKKSAADESEKKRVYGKEQENGGEANQPSFGQQFKNKISSLLGRKTRIAWELSEKTKTKQVDWVDSTVKVSCI